MDRKKSSKTLEQRIARDLSIPTFAAYEGIFISSVDRKEADVGRRQQRGGNRLQWPGGTRGRKTERKLNERKGSVTFHPHPVPPSEFPFSK